MNQTKSMAPMSMGRATPSATMPFGRGQPNLSGALVLLMFMSLGILGVALSFWMHDRTTFIYLTVLLLAYLGFEIRRFAKIQPDRWLASPAVLGSMATFGLFLGVTNGVFFLPDTRAGLFYRELWTGEFRPLNTVMLLALLAAFAMWRGYYAPLGRMLVSRLERSKTLAKIIRQRFELNVPVVLVLFVVSVAVRLLQIRLGLHGFGGGNSHSDATVNFRQYLGMGSALGNLTLIVVSLNLFFKAPGYRYSKVLLPVALSCELLFGFLSGMKSRALIPLLVVVICAYVAKNRSVRLLLPAIPLAYLLVFQVIQPFRTLILTDPNFQYTPSYIAKSLIAAASGDVRQTLDVRSGSNSSMLLRFNFTLMASHAIEYRQHGLVTDADPEFLRDIFMAPVYAVVPRVLWPSKPVVRTGGWFNEIVLGRNNRSAVGMSPLGYLYLAGGSIGVALGFFFVGVWQRVLYDGFFFRGGGGMLVFLGMLLPVVWMPHAFHPLIVSIIRTGPLLLLIQFLIFKPSPRANRATLNMQPARA